MGKKRFYYKGASWCMLLIFMISFICTPVFAMDSKEEKEAANFKQMVDNYMIKAMEECHVPGATLVAVKDGKILLKKGYGYADLENKVPVDPDKTLFRIGSVSKLFTATAAMQLVEQGKIDLDTDINKYLKDVKIESKCDKPITMANLLTHTAGFDERLKGILSDKLLDEPNPLEDIIKKEMPPFIRRPGEVVQYSNHGYTLIGYIVEQVSGIPFDKYVEENIFNPLGMNDSSYYLSTDILSNTSKGYIYENEHFEAEQPGGCLVHPAGSICSTADDMAKFLVAHLQNGKYSNNRILKENTAINMHTVQFTNYKFLPGYSYGFYENTNNRSIIEHGGNTQYFSSLLSLCPEKNIGFFISSNSCKDDEEIRDGFSEEFYKFFGVNKESNFTEGTEVDFKGDLEKFEGDYVCVRRTRNDYYKIYGLLWTFKVRVNENGELHVKAMEPISGDYTRIEENLFKNTDNDKLIYFKEDKDGKQYMILEVMAPAQAWERLSTQESILVNIVAPFIVLTALLGCINGVINLFRKNKIKYTGISAWLKRISSIICLFILMLVVSLFMFIANGGSWIIFINFIGIAIAVCSVVMLILGILSVWKKILMPIWSRIFHIIISLAGVAIVIIINYINMFPWN
ncbi:serine hydrolase domain-containing protein [Abyssisolibacter fermentans]|uniref:serine hydrolase domain-containing protein n=1 Tax=Abyssisolibacter fermentans TaxID=1766203 RepID=UPI00082D3926|nr:serine hydrolase [Abyssisolibacter fermentans]